MDNELKLATLLRSMTYRELRGLADHLAEVVNDQADEIAPDEMALWLLSWADAQFDAEATP